MRVMKEDEIWDGAEYIWRHMPSCDVARAFVLSYRIAKKIVSVQKKTRVEANKSIQFKKRNKHTFSFS